MQCTSPLLRTADGKISRLVHWNPKWKDDEHFKIRCGSCMACRIHKKKEWKNRIHLELMSHPESVFITLTYDDVHLPNPSNLVKSDLQKYFKKLRKANLQFRYFAVGEYGDQSWRPHYHAILFGISPLQEKILLEKWNKGFIQVASVEKERVDYVVGYTIKKMTNKKDNRLEGRNPEFMLSSKGYPGGIGASAINELVTFFRDKSIYFKTHNTIPLLLKCGTQKYTIGKYLVEKICDQLSCEKPVNEYAIKQEMMQLLEADFDLTIFNEMQAKSSYNRFHKLRHKYSKPSNRSL